MASWFNGKRNIMLAVLRQPDANTVEVVDSVKALIPIFRAAIPPSVDLEIVNDRSISIRNSVDDVQFTLGLTIALVVLVIFVFLRNVTATIIPALALPVSLIGTFAGMYMFGYSIDNLSLLAITLSVGFVVDDAIVMLENIVRHIESGMQPMEAALKGSAEIGFTILSITLSLVRRVHPGAVHGRHRRPAVPRVRGHHQPHHHDLRHRLADADADAELAPPEIASRQRASQLVLPRVGSRVRRLAARLCLGAARRHAGAPHHALRDIPVPRCRALSLRRRAEGLLPDRGYRPHLRHHRGGARTRPSRR